MTKQRATPDFFQALGRILVQGAVDAGNRAVTSAVRSVAKDGKRLMKHAAKKLEEVEVRASDFIGDDEDDDLPDERVVDVEVETPKPKRKRTS
jgi:hypothetical protein